MKTIISLWFTFTCACYTTHKISTETLNPLKQNAKEKDAILLEIDQKKVRVDPNTKLRFLRRDGTYTPWIRASLLFVNEEGVFISPIFSADANPDGLFWSDISTAEVKNLDGLKSLGAIAITTTAVVAIVALLSDGKPKPPKIRAPSTNCCNVYAVPNVNVVGPLPNPPPYLVEEKTLGKEGFVTPNDATASALFSPRVQRKAGFKMVASLDAGVALAQGEPGQTGTLAGAALAFRVSNMFEVGGGIRQISTQSRTPRIRNDLENAFLGFARAGFHLNLGPKHKLAIPLSVDLGGALDSVYLRFNGGLRFQLGKSFALGLFPVSPTFIDILEDDNKEGAWSFPSSVELSVSF